MKLKFKNLKTSINLGFFLALRQVRRGSVWTTALIVFVMMLTFLNLVVVRGVLVGLIQSSADVYRERYAGDVLISDLPKKSYIENSPSIIDIVKKLPWTESYSARYVEGGKLEADYKTRINYTDDPNEANGLIAGINPVAEDKTTGLSKKVIEGNYLSSSDTESILVGANLLKKYLPIDSPGLKVLSNVEVGTKVRLTVNNNTKEFIVKGVVKSKVGEVDQRIFMLDSTLRTLIGRSDYNVDEIAIKITPGTNPNMVKNALVLSGVSKTARIQTAEEALPQFLLQIRDTFSLLGNMIGSIGLVVASITIFIVIFINAITRRKFIGILKGIGVNSLSIEISYIIQSIFYALLGTFFGVLVLYGFLVPYIAHNPINFPFSDGILVAEYPVVFVRVLLLIGATLIAGYIPARIVTKQNTLDAILGK